MTYCPFARRVFIICLPMYECTCTRMFAMRENVIFMCRSACFWLLLSVTRFSCIWRVFGLSYPCIHRRQIWVLLDAGTSRKLKSQSNIDISRVQMAKLALLMSITCRPFSIRLIPLILQTATGQLHTLIGLQESGIPNHVRLRDVTDEHLKNNMVHVRDVRSTISNEFKYKC